MTFLRELGILRIGLGIISIIFMFCAPSSGATVAMAGWGVLRTLIMPAIVPLICMVLLFDALMSRVMIADKTANQARRFKTIIIINLGLVALLVIAWSPYLLSVLI